MYIYYLVLFLYIIKLYIYLTTLFQQNHYDFKKYLKSIKSIYILKPYQYKYYISLIFVCLSYISKYFLIFAILSILISFMFKNNYIIKLKYTKRIIRLTVTNTLIYMLYMIITYKYIYIASIYPLILPFILILSNIINKPIELLINRYYYKKAKKKLETYPSLYKIAITGSYGKTSTKDIINSILETKYNTLKTPASFNTLMGLSYTINNNKLKMLDFLILEMGAFRQNEIKQMTCLFKPNIRIITEIGPQHMSTFKTIDNIKKAKFEILSNINKNDIIILNYENEYIRSCNLEEINNKNIYTYGINYGDVIAKNIIYKENILEFDIYYKDDFILSVKTKQLSKSNIMNILSAFTTIFALNNLDYNISYDTFKKQIEDQKPSPHRMEYKKINNIHIYDDSYSSNIKGFINACEVLKMQKGKRIIITPGIVDGGKHDEILNKEISKHIINTFDYIYLINNKSSKYIEKELKKENKEYKVFNKFIDAYNQVLTFKETDIYLLIENDLPDSFLER